MKEVIDIGKETSLQDWSALSGVGDGRDVFGQDGHQSCPLTFHAGGRGLALHGISPE